MRSVAPVITPIHALKCELASETLRESGHLRLCVNGWSMLPSVWPGDTLLVQRAKTCEISKGDIVLFSRHRRLCAHRVYSCKNLQLLTRGDAMQNPDEPVREDELLGKVVLVWSKGCCFEPRKNLTVWERMVAALVRSSYVAARLVVGTHEVWRSRNLQTI